MGFVDLHSHVLPGIDDGAPDTETSHKLLSGLAELGFEEVCATPHQKDGSWVPTREEILGALSEIGDDLPVRLRLAAENMWDSVFLERTPSLSFPRYEAEEAAFLFEVPVATMPPNIEDQLFRFRLQGVLPVMAHPERYGAIQRDAERARSLSRSAALVVDLGALGGHHGREASRTARSLVEMGLVHAAASDLHREAELPEVADGIQWLRKKVGNHGLEQMLSKGPREILTGELPPLEE